MISMTNGDNLTRPSHCLGVEVSAVLRTLVPLSRFNNDSPLGGYDLARQFGQRRHDFLSVLRGERGAHRQR